MAIGGVKLAIYYYYIKSIGWIMVISTVLLYLSFTGFSVGSSIWLSQWYKSSSTSGGGLRQMGDILKVRSDYAETGGQSYKASTIVISDSRVVPDWKIPILRP